MRVIWRVDAKRPLSELVKALAEFAETHPDAQVSRIGPPDPEDAFAVEIGLKFSFVKANIKEPDT